MMSFGVVVLAVNTHSRQQLGPQISPMSNCVHLPGNQNLLGEHFELTFGIFWQVRVYKLLCWQCEGEIFKVVTVAYSSIPKSYTFFSLGNDFSIENLKDV